MRNLRIVGRSLLRFSGDDPLPLAGTAWDAASNAIVCAFGPSESRAVIELKRLHHDRDNVEERLESIASWDAPCPLPSLHCDSILNLHHFSDSGTTCLVLAGGDIILVRENPLPNEELIEIVGSIDAGISAAAWSPDEELLAIATQADTLLLMSRDIENISNITLSPDDVNVSNHVSVGWGKKETQFKGKRAKALQDPTVPERIDEGVLSPFDDRSVSISWRGDGAYFAVNSVEQERRRMIRVYSREGQLDSVSEPVDGLEGALSWRPSGNLIAGIKRNETGVEVVFFERNGLRHGQFDLRFTSAELEALTEPLTLRWNSDSNVLAVSHPDRVQLWTMSNYHYYLKQELAMDKDAARTVMCDWHSERPLSLALSTSGTLQLLDYLFTTSTGSVVPPNDSGLVASIDGLSLKLTPLRIANVPPPMSLLKLDLQSKPMDVAISKSGTRLAVVSAEDLAVYSLDLSKRPVAVPIPLWRSDAIKGHNARHVAFLGDEHVCVLSDSWEEEDTNLWISFGEELLDRGVISEKGRPSTFVPSVDYEKLYLQYQDASVYEVSPEDVPSIPVHRFPSFAPETRIAIQDDKPICFGLTRTGVLYANDRILVRNCTAFVVTSAHLIFTTTQHLLKFVHLVSVDELEVPSDEPQKDERCRSIERGARIVTVMPTSYTVVLQMPRGNLETIYPRALVLAAIRRSIEADQYGEAFITCRNQRVDMNILHDHDPERFMANISKTVAQIKRVEHIDLLLSQLRNEDVSETMYKETLKTKDQMTKSKQDTSAIESKVNRICDAFLSVLTQQQQKETHLQNVITAHVCKVPPDLESGLEVIGKLHEAQDPLTDRAAEHICFLADVNQLYDTSLGIYNLDLALLIAQQSQKDPREYLPHLQSLQSLPLIRRKFAIDDQLGRHAKALSHLKDLDEFAEACRYIQNHTLYTQALELYQYENARLKEIMRLYAEHLAATNKHRESAIAYEYLSDHANAWSEYKSANMWEESLSSASLAGVSEDELKNLAESLAEDLTASKSYHAASTVTLQYLSDLPSALRLLCRGSLFSSAIRLATLHKQPDLVEEVIDPGLIERSAEMTELLAEMKGQLGAQVPRLLELRKKKAEDPMAYLAGEVVGDGAVDIPDNLSVAPTETTSGGTFMTRYTNRSGTTGTLNTTTTRRTSKKKRQEERKRARGKKGTVYEEEYLVNSIERLIERVNSLGAEVERLVEGLVRRGMRERGMAVERAMGEVVRGCEGAVGEVYGGAEEGGKEDEGVGQGMQGIDGNGVGGVNGGGGGEAAFRPMGADATLWASMEEVSKKREAPVVKAFAKMSLLG